jgi:hypothetical protein
VGSGRPLSQTAFDTAVNQWRCEPASLWAILSVETHGFGFLADRRPKILFERHIFSARTGHAFDAGNPDVSQSVPGGYVGGAGEYDRLARAIALNRQAALESASWGLGQVMGYNATGLKYPAVEDMVAAFETGEDAQLTGCVRFVLNNAALQKALQAHDWATVAYYYNGKDYAKNAYDTQLAGFYAHFSGPNQMPSVRVRGAQARLSYLGIDPKGVDGVMGPGARAALLQFQKLRNLPQTADLDVATDTALIAAVGV